MAVRLHRNNAHAEHTAQGTLQEAPPGQKNASFPVSSILASGPQAGTLAAAERKPSLKVKHSLSSFSILPKLLIPQTLHRVRHRCFYGLKTYGCQCNEYCGQPGCGK